MRQTSCLLLGLGQVNCERVRPNRRANRFVPVEKLFTLSPLAGESSVGCLVEAGAFSQRLQSSTVTEARVNTKLRDLYTESTAQI